MARAGLWQVTKHWLIEALGGSALGAISMGDGDDAGWRPITERATHGTFRRDLSPLSQEQMLRIAHYLYTGNALAQFMVNVPVALAVGRSVGYTLKFDSEAMKIDKQAAEDLAKRARRVLDPWWEHPVHDFKGRAQQYAKTYLVTGELLLVIPENAVNNTTGLPLLSYEDSALISSVHGRGGFSTTPGTVLVKYAGGDPKPFDVILPGLPKPDGSASLDCFFFRHAGRLNSLRGNCYFLAQADWIDLHDQLLFGRVDKAVLSNTLVHDLLVKNATDENAVKKEVDKFRVAAVKPGGIFGHNENVEHSIKTADLKEQDSAALLRTVLLHVLGSKGFPEHWFAEGGNSNRATSQEQNEVAFKMVEGLQEELLHVFRTPLHYAYDQLAGKQQIFPRRETGAVSLEPDLPKISERDISRVGGIVANVESALDVMVESRRISRRTAQVVSLTIIEKLTGQRVDPNEEGERIELEKAEMEQLEQERANAAAKAAADLAKQLGDDDGDPDERKAA